MERKDQEFMVQKIRTQYTEKESTQLDALKALDAKVKRPVNVFAYVFGSISAIIMGSGMSLVMTDISQVVGIENPMVTGIVIGVVGMVLALINYPMYKKMLSSRKNKYADQILKLSDEIMQSNENADENTADVTEETVKVEA
ncbi:MAG: dihydropteridine reductase [Lachnospiraceae bacterium]|nr:dihydropteridine reductase [Lachnospiraceae bacterium]